MRAGLKGAGAAGPQGGRRADVKIPSGKQGRVLVSTKGSTSPSKPLTRAEQEVQSAAERLTAQIDDALAAVSVSSPDGVDDLDATADRLERAARDLSVALRELAEERKHREAE